MQTSGRASASLKLRGPPYLGGVSVRRLVASDSGDRYDPPRCAAHHTVRPSRDRRIPGPEPGRADPARRHVRRRAARHSTRRAAHQRHSPRPRRRHARHDGPAGQELLATADGLRDHRAARSANADDHGQRDDHAAQQQPATARRSLPAAGPQHLSRPRPAGRVGPGREHRRHGDHENQRERRSRGPDGPGGRTRRRRRAAVVRLGTGSDAGPHRARRASSGQVNGETGNRLAHQTARRHERARPSHDAAL